MKPMKLPMGIVILVIALAKSAQAASEIILKSPPEAILRQVLEKASDGQSVTIETPAKGWRILLTSPLAVKGVSNFKLISTPGPTYLEGDQLSYQKCHKIRHENFAHRFHGQDDVAEIAREIMRTDGLDGRGLVLQECSDVVVSRCSFAACSDDMAGAGGYGTRGIVYERCLFSMPLGIYGQGMLIWTNEKRIVHIDDLVKIDRCVFSHVTYRTPKLEGGFCLVTNCVMAGNLSPIELKEPDVVFAGCMFAPDPRMRQKVIGHADKPVDVRRLGVFGNWYRGPGPSFVHYDEVPENQWDILVGNCRGVLDKEGLIPRTGEQIIDQWRLKMTPDIARKVIIESGPTVTDDVDLLAKRYALWQCGLQDHLYNGGK